MVGELTQRFSFHWPYPQHIRFTDEAIEQLVGQRCAVQWQGSEWSGLIIDAQRREDDEWLSSGLWITIAPADPEEDSNDE